MIEHDRMDAIEDARRLLRTGPFVLDTETTGLGNDAEICEIAVIDGEGDVVLNSRVRPVGGISEKAAGMHGIRDADVADMPGIGDVLSHGLLSALLDGSIAIYNADFDLRLIRQSAAAVGRYDIVEDVMLLRSRAVCVMEMYARYAGFWVKRHRSYRFHSLTAAAQQLDLDWNGDAHSALADVRMTLEVLRSMSDMSGAALS